MACIMAQIDVQRIMLGFLVEGHIFNNDCDLSVTNINNNCMQSARWLQMSRNARTRSQLLSVYYNLTPCHARLLNVLSSMGIKIHRSQATKQGLKYKMRRFSHE